MLEQGRIEAAGAGQEVAYGRPVRRAGVGQAQGGRGAGGSGCGRGRGRAVSEERDGLAETAAAGVQDQVDRAAAAVAAGVIEELGAADAQQRTRTPPAFAVARVARVAEPLGERLEGAVAQAVGTLAQALEPDGGGAGHGRISSQAR